MSGSFESLLLSANMIEALKKENIFVPTDIQKRTIPLLLENRDVIAQSGTGTGKTLAYLLPLFDKMKSGRKSIQTIIMAPTHELVIQIQRTIERLSLNSGIAVSSTPLIGSANINRQIDKLKTKPQIVVGSPGRILELVNQNKIPGREINTVVLDEADRLLDSKNSRTVLTVLSKVSKTSQMVFFSATITPDTFNKTKSLMKSPLIVKSDTVEKASGIVDHFYLKADQREKIETLRKLIRIVGPEKGLIFLNRKDRIENLLMKLEFHGIKAESIHGTDDKENRQKIMRDFKNGKVKFMIASDIAARGLQMDAITHVFNMDMSDDPGDYIHRSGRTGRNGLSGKVYSILTENEIALIKKIEQRLDIKIKFQKMREGEIVSAE